MKRITCLLLGMLVIPSALFAGSINDNLAAGSELRQAVSESQSAGDLNAESVVSAMQKHRKNAALIFLYSAESNSAILEELLTGLPDELESAVIDAVLVAVMHDLPILQSLISAIAKANVPLAKEVIYAVTEVFPEKSKLIFDYMILANNEAQQEFENSYTDALAAMGSEGTQNGDLYEAYEPEEDVSPA